MTRRRLVLLALAPLLALFPAVTGAPGAAPASAATSCPVASVRTGRTLVSFDRSLTPVEAAGRLRDAGASDVEPVGPGLAVGRLAGRDRPRGARHVEAEVRHRLQATSNDEFRPLQWALDVVHADAAANRTDGAGITVAVIDTGVDGTHVDLAGRVADGADVTRSTIAPIAAGTDSDVAGHGTAVAGVIAAVRNNGTGVAGLAPGASILPVRAGDAGGVTSSSMIRGIQWAASHGARIINMSFGDCERSAAEQQAVTDAVGAGVLLVASAGNATTGRADEPADVYPAAYDGVIAVAATTRDDARASYSMGAPWVDVAAPGGAGDGRIEDDILTTSRPEPAFGCTAQCYDVAAGTSFASPYVAAELALIWSANPTLRPADVEAIAKATSIDLGAPGPDREFGWGRVDAAAAAALAKGTRTLRRVAGGDRYATAAALSAEAFPSGAPVAYLARGDVFSPDALAAGPAAITRAGPVLLTRPCELPVETAGELQRLGSKTIVVLGGTSAVCDPVLDQVRALSSAPTVRRLSGGDRYETAAALAGDTFPTGASTAYLARGDAFSPDALVGGVAAGRAGAPILLATGCGLPPATSAALDALGERNIVVLGGPGAVCDAVVQTLQASGRTVVRLAGADRFATAVAVARSAFPGAVPGVLVARGDAFSPDALTAAPYAAARGLPLVLSAQCAAPPATGVFVNDMDAPAVVVAGGSTAVCDAVLNRFL